jgi:hypothetical protein
MATLKGGKARGQEAIHSTAELLNLTDAQVQAAVRYYAVFTRRDRSAHRFQRRSSEFTRLTAAAEGLLEGHDMGMSFLIWLQEAR